MKTGDNLYLSHHLKETTTQLAEAKVENSVLQKQLAQAKGELMKKTLKIPTHLEDRFNTRFLQPLPCIYYGNSYVY